ncbi:MAG: response regulator transcription factor [Anaerolineae bacterium]|nr:response regulator transcription factor [Anaerolineae bacterium]
MITILVVDDEDSIQKAVTAYLKVEGYTVYSVTHGRQVLPAFQRYKPQLVILDVMLPGMDGFEVLQQLRRESEVYVLMLTAKSEETDRVVGLTMGADDYLTKPFSPRELVARVKAILRRGRSAALNTDSILHFRHIQIDVQRRVVLRDEQEVDLTALEFELLKTLASYPGVVFSRTKLLESVWGYDFYGDERVVDVHVGRIRQKLESDLSNPQFIQTVRGVGYKFEDEAP